MRHLRITILSLILISSAVQASHRADTVLYNGKIFTADGARPWAEAIALRGSRILSVGSNAHVRTLEGPQTLSLDLGGRLVIPGLNDAHSHLGVALPRLSPPPINIPGPGPSLNQALAQVTAAVAQAEPGEWILVLVGEATLLNPSADRRVVDPIAPNNPVVMISWTNHTAILNTVAMTAAGISETALDPFGGTYGRFEDSNVLNGVANEYALFRVFRPIRASIPDEVVRIEFEALTAVAAQLGVTSVQEMTIGISGDRVHRILAGADLSIRMRSICVPLELHEPCPVSAHGGSSKLSFSGIKWLLDGTPVERSAALSLPYADAPGTGTFNFTDGELAGLIHRGRFGSPRGRQLLLHTVGDRAIGKTLEALEDAAPPWVWRRRRPRLEHADLMQAEHLEKIRRLGVTVVQNPLHLALDLEPALGAERAAAAQPLSSLLAAGVHLAIGSESTVPDPFLVIFFALLHPFHPQEGLTIEQALTAYTRGSARAEFQDHRKGTLRRGFLADLAVLSQDLFEVPLEAIPGTTSVLTLVGGDIVWDAGVLDP